jgi:hypothetical protein
MENELRDIKPLLEIPDSSYYLFIGLIVLAVVILFAFVVFLVKKFWKTRKVEMKKVYLQELKALDWIDTKHSAYLATELGRKLATEERTEEIYAQLVPMLEAYKYKKEVPSLDDETLKQFNLLVHVLDESI